MIHIKEIMDRIIESSRKAKFYHNNQDIFLKYFESLESYNNFIIAGNFNKLESIIKENTKFKSEDFINNLRGENV